MPKTILIVEDEAPLRHALAEKFTKEGYHVVEAEDGVVGLQVAAAHHPDLMLLDLLMPHMDGIAMLQRIRHESWGADLPIIILTNVQDIEKVQQAVESKAYDFLVKSDWTLEKIVEKVQRTIGSA